MAENDENKIDGEEKLPEDFRPVIPEPEIRRPSVYNFRKDFPENESPTSTHRISFARQEARRKLRRNIFYVVALVLTFSVGFILTDAAIRVSREPIPPTTAQITQPPTQESTAPTEQSASQSESESETAEEPVEEQPTTAAQTKPQTKPSTTAKPTTTVPPTTTQAPTTQAPTTAPTEPTTTQAPTTQRQQIGIFGF